jgi:hypothetical protein
MVPVTGEETTRQTLSDIAPKLGLQNALFGCSSSFVLGAQNCSALRNFTELLHQFSFFSTLFRHFDYQKSFLMRNKYDIRNQGENLYRITDNSIDYFFHKKSMCILPQPVSSEIFHILCHR